ncbi:MAG: large-conductance mechanosensitive channel protein MscL [Clostridiales bacterium]|jgi:large conductance mechanosensitive channel|nr:large-conductance mechanosensitive channel protein MscL [Clostridiales bacterium]
MGKKGKSSGFLQEFKKFAMRGNVIDLAVGVIIGGAFGKITSSLVNDVLMPFIGMFLGGVDFSRLAIRLPDFFGSGEENLMNIGLLLSAIIDFLIIAFVVFLMIRTINRLKERGRQEEEPAAPAAPPEPSAEEKLLTEIRDLLKEKKI